MMGVIWMVLLVALTGSHLGHCSPLRSTPQTYPHDAPRSVEGWSSEDSVYAAVPALVLVITAVGILFGCTWCYRHKDCKLFTASATHLHDGRRAHPPDSGFSEPVNNNISEDNNNGPISLREMQNIANNNAAAYIVSENEERNRVSRESVVEFEPLPTGIRVADPLEHCADWFGEDDFTRDRLQYLREIGRGWFGRVVEGEIEDSGSTTPVAVKILTQQATLEDKARFLDEAKLYRDVNHENVLAFVARCLQEEPWILLFELCSMDLQQYLIANRPKMAILNESGIPLRLICDVTAGIAHLHSRGYLYGMLCSSGVQVRGEGDSVRAVLGTYVSPDPSHYIYNAPETSGHAPVYTSSSEVWSLGAVVWRVCAWGAPAPALPPPPPTHPARYSQHLYQVMQLCWQPDPSARPTAQQVLALVQHLQAPGADFEQRWQRLKPNTIPTRDEHRALIHASGPADSSNDTLGVHLDLTVSRSSSIMSEEPLSVQIKSESLTNLHGSLDDVRNIYLTHNEMAVLECHQGNIALEEAREKEQDRSDASMDPWLKDIIAGSQDDVSYYKDVSDVIKNLDNILNSEKTSSSESSHQASPSRDNLSLDCKKDYPVQSCMVKSPGITNFQSILDTGFGNDDGQTCEDDDVDRDTIGTLSHSFERHSEFDTTSQHTLENLTPDTPIKDLDVVGKFEIQVEVEHLKDNVVDIVDDTELPNDIVNSVNEIPKLKELCVASISSASDEQCVIKDCQTSCDSNLKSTDSKEETKSIDDVVKVIVTPDQVENKENKDLNEELVDDIVLPKMVEEVNSKILDINEIQVEVEEKMHKINKETKLNDVSITEVTEKDLVQASLEINCLKDDSLEKEVKNLTSISTPESVQSKLNESNNMNSNETETPTVLMKDNTPLPPEIVQNIFKEQNEPENEMVNINENDIYTEECNDMTDKENDDTNTSEENNVSDEDLDINDCENKTVSEVSEYTKWINYAITPQSIQNVSDFIRTERDHVLNENKHNKHILNDINDDDFEIISQEDCIEVTPAGSQLADHCLEISNDFSEDSLMQASQDCNDDANAIHSAQKCTPTHIELTETNFENNKSKENVLDLNGTEIVIEENNPSPFKCIVQPDEVTPRTQIYVDHQTQNSRIAKQDDYFLLENICEESLSQESHEEVLEPIQPSKFNENDESPHIEVTSFESNAEKENALALEIYDNLTADPIIKEIVTSEEVAENNTVGNNESANSNHKEEKKSGDIMQRSEETLLKETSDSSTVYMDLINDTNNQILTTNNTVDTTNIYDVITSCVETSETENVCSLLDNESTKYLDLPSFGIKQVDNFLHMEKVYASYGTDAVSSTPLASDSSNNANTTLENSLKDSSDSQLMFETKIANYGPGVSMTKLEQKYVPDSLSPFESPTKSHPTDTYDENSSVVLGPFENCTLELFKAVKSTELVDLPKEELLAFSSNFSEINLETPSPLRDGNFLNEVPDIAHDDIQFDDIQDLSDKPPSDPTESDTINSGTEKRISPSTPPNSPGVFLASTSQQKYLVDIDLTPEVHPEPDLSIQKEIELNQIELQITSKLAMAENENNMNIEYSGPLTVEGLISEEGMVLRDSDDVLPESYLAGNGGSIEDDLREDLTLDEECVKALRNELELKLPLAQVASIEPPCENDTEWSAELPPPPELIVSYPGALSPIAEETGQQLSAYENDMQWNQSVRTDSSESYPEPCNLSTEDATQHSHSTYTLHRTHTYTVRRDVDAATTTEITMSADSLNASPYKKPVPNTDSPIDDKTYTKEEEKESLERISQVSPFLLSPTTDTSMPENSENLDNATGVSTLSKTTLPTDAKLSKPSETQCLSKATSIDSWCSNDTLYNVEENFDDLAMDPDMPEFEPDKDEGNSESTDTLTHHDEEKEGSHCSTYIIHDSKSEVCDTFSPDSITANDNYTYTKARTDNANTTPSVITTELNDSTKNTQTKDLAYGTLMSGLPSYSNCTTELASGFDEWKVQQPELVRKSPMPDNIDITPSNTSDDNLLELKSPQLADEPSIKKMDSVDITCLQENLTDIQNKTEDSDTQNIEVDSPNYNYKDMAPSITSTPIVEVVESADVQPIPIKLHEVTPESNEDEVNLPNFITFQQSAEVRPQDLSNSANNAVSQDTEILLEGDSKTLSRNSNRDSLVVSERTPTYSDFENSAISKPQDVNTKDKSSQSNESGISSEDFQRFESSVRSRPQDLSSLIDASSLLLKSERLSSEMAMSSFPSDLEQISQETNEEHQEIVPNFMTINESHSLMNFREPSFLINMDVDDETEQPHSIIITETAMEAFKESPNKTYDLPAEVSPFYDSHSSKHFEQLLEDKVNGDITKSEEDNLLRSETSPKNSLNDFEDTQSSEKADLEDIANLEDTEEIKCNGGSEKFATVNFLNETFEELLESNVDDTINESKDLEKTESIKSDSPLQVIESTNESKSIKEELSTDVVTKSSSEINGTLTTVTEDFLQNEKMFCALDTCLPMLSDIRFTGPAAEIMSTSFTQDSPTEPTSGECPRLDAADIIKDWDSDSDSHSTNSSSGEFIWKQRTGESQDSGCNQRDNSEGGNGSGASDASGDSGSGSEGDEVEFVPSSWDCRAAPSKSSLRSLEQTTPDNKKRVVFKRQKYHCVYEYPRETSDIDTHSPAAYLPDLSTYSEWDPTSAEEAELGYGQLFGAPSPLDLYPLRAGIAFGADYDEDFFISSSARPFESLCIMTSQFFPGKHMKPSLLERDLSDDVTEDFPPPPSPLPTTTLMQTRTPSLDFTTPDSGVEDITPGSTTDEDFKKKLPETELTWRPVDSGSSSESVSPSSPGGEALGGLRHTRDKLKLDLPPSPHIPSPRHSRVFNFVLDKPKRREERTEIGTTPLVMTDDTPIVTTSLPLQKDCEELPVPEPTFSTFGKSVPKVEPEQKLILTDELDENNTEVKDEAPSPKVVEAVKGEGTVLDSGDEDSGIESSSKATLERNKSDIS